MVDGKRCVVALLLGTAIPLAMYFGVHAYRDSMNWGSKDEGSMVATPGTGSCSESQKPPASIGNGDILSSAIETSEVKDNKVGTYKPLPTSGFELKFTKLPTPCFKGEGGKVLGLGARGLSTMHSANEGFLKSIFPEIKDLENVKYAFAYPDVHSAEFPDGGFVYFDTAAPGSAMGCLKLDAAGDIPMTFEYDNTEPVEVFNGYHKVTIYEDAKDFTWDPKCTPNFPKPSLGCFKYLMAIHKDSRVTFVDAAARTKAEGMTFGSVKPDFLSGVGTVFDVGTGTTAGVQWLGADGKKSSVKTNIPVELLKVAEARVYSLCPSGGQCHPKGRNVKVAQHMFSQSPAGKATESDTPHAKLDDARTAMFKGDGLTEQGPQLLSEEELPKAPNKESDSWLKAPQGASSGSPSSSKTFKGTGAETSVKDMAAKFK